MILVWRVLQARNLTSRVLQSWEVAVDRQEPMVLQSSLELANEQLDTRQQLANTTAPLNHTRPSLHKHSSDGATKAEDQMLWRRDVFRQCSVEADLLILKLITFSAVVVQDGNHDYILDRVNEKFSAQIDL